MSFTTPQWLTIAKGVARPLRHGHALRRSDKEILIIKLDSLGDMLLFAGAFRLIKDHYRARLTVLAFNETRSLLETNPAIDRIIGLDRHALGHAGFISRCSRCLNGIRLLSRHYDVMLNPSSLEIPLAEALAGSVEAEEKIGIGSVPKETRYSRLIPVPSHAHIMDQTVAWLHGLGISGAPGRKDIFPEVFLTAKDRDMARQTLEQTTSDPSGTKHIALCAGARISQKDWGAERFVDLIKKLQFDFPLHIWLLGSEADGEKYEYICDRLADCAGISVSSLAGSLSLRETMALIAQVDLCLGNDTFGLHAAIVMGTPSVVVIGKGDGDQWIPWANPQKHRMVQSAVDCSGCRWQCIHPEPKCLKDISVDDVLKEARAAMDNT